MGRTRKSGERYPGGKLKPDQSMPGAKMRRIVEMASKGAADPVLGTPIGWLLMSGELAETSHMANIMAEAATLYGNQRAKWDGAAQVPSRNARSPDHNKVAKGAQSDTDGGNRGLAYDRTRERVIGLLGHDIASKALSALDDAIVCLERPSWGQITMLKVGLIAVATANGMLPGGSVDKHIAA